MPPIDPGRIIVLGVPSSAGARDLGQEKTPAHFRRRGLVERLRAVGLDVEDIGDLPVVHAAPDFGDPNCRNLLSVASVAKHVADTVQRIIDERARLLVIGGDCTITIGVIAGLRRRLGSLGMLYLDGDLDLNTPETTPSGILDGMGLAHILGRGASALSRLGSHYPSLEEHNVCPFGYSVAAGGIDEAERTQLERLEMAHYPREAMERDVRACAQAALHELERRVDRILVHFDIDVVDYRDFPATKLPHSPGLTLMQTQHALEAFMRSSKAAALVVTEFNADCDATGRLADQAIGMLGAALAGG